MWVLVSLQSLGDTSLWHYVSWGHWYWFLIKTSMRFFISKSKLVHELSILYIWSVNVLINPVYNNLKQSENIKVGVLCTFYYEKLIPERFCYCLLKYLEKGNLFSVYFLYLMFLCLVLKWYHQHIFYKI